MTNIVGARLLSSARSLASPIAVGWEIILAFDNPAVFEITDDFGVVTFQEELGDAVGAGSFEIPQGTLLRQWRITELGGENLTGLAALAFSGEPFVIYLKPFTDEQFGFSEMGAMVGHPEGGAYVAPRLHLKEVVEGRRSFSREKPPAGGMIRPNRSRSRP